MGWRIFSTVFWTFLVLSCVPLFLGALLIFAVTYPFDPNRRLLHLYSCVWAQLYFWVNPLWRLRIAGREKLPWRGPAVLVANHQSLGDILVLFGLYRPFKWVSKQSVFKVPLVGWNMRLNGYVGLVRGSRESVLKMLADCEAWLDRGVPVLLFPEGTRSPDGQVKDFKDGAFHLAVKKGCPVIPIALTGTARTLPKNGFRLRDHADCRVRVLDPVDPAPFNGDVAALREHVRARIVEGVAQLDREKVPGRLPTEPPVDNADDTGAPVHGDSSR
jgi:1-acyl-sn-glycerol-3-phosphate acyltransferase